MRGFDTAAEAEIAGAVLLALKAHNFALPSYKSSKIPVSRLKTVRVFNSDKRMDAQRTLAEADGLNLARWFTVQPPNKLNAASYRKAG